LKKTVFILIIITFTLLYYLGILTKEETLPLSKDVSSIDSPLLTERAFDTKEIGFLKFRSGDRRASFFSKKELDQLYQLKLDKGIRNLPVLSLFLIREAKKARKNGNSDRAIELATYSIQLSPDLPQPYFELARAHWQRTPFQLNKILPEIFKGQMARFNHYPSSLSFFYNIFYILSNAILMAFIVFGIVVMVKYFPLYFYDLRKNLTQKMSSFFSNGIKSLFLFVPFFLRLDILWAILFWNILLWGYVGKKERQFIVVFLIILAYLPLFLRSSSSVLNGFSSDIILEMNEANQGNWDRGTEERLRQWLAIHPDDAEVLFTLGLIEKRQGRYHAAEEFYQKAADHGPNFSKIFSNLGNVYLAQKKTQEAIAFYQQAIKLNRNKGAYYFNLYRAYSQETLLSERIGRAYQRARQLDPGLVDYYSMIESPNMNRLVVDEVLTTQRLWERFLPQLFGREWLLIRLFTAWFEKIPSGVPFLFPIIFLGFLIEMSRYSRARRFLTRCPMCGNPTYRLYLGTSDQEFVCFNCYRVFIQKEKLYPKVEGKKSIQTHEFQKQNHFTAKFLSFFFVGFGHLWREDLFKGLILLFLFFIFILRFIYWNGVVISPVAQPFISAWSIIFWGGLFILFYLLSIRWAYKEKPRFETER
jgi:tetratricopeptide (TPR) repeat protein